MKNILFYKTLNVIPAPNLHFLLIPVFSRFFCLKDIPSLDENDNDTKLFRNTSVYKSELHLGVEL